MPWKDKEKASEYGRRYKAAHREEIRSNGREYYAKNRDKILERQKRKREENPEETKRKGRENYARNREKILAAREKRSPEIKEKEKIYREKYREEHKEELATKAQEYYRNNKKDRQDAERYRKYGITGDEYDAMIEAQGYKCAICSEEFDTSRQRSINVDHCHESGVVRGLLCKDCNTGLGHFRDNINTLISAATYLERTTPIHHDNDNNSDSKSDKAA